MCDPYVETIRLLRESLRERETKLAKKDADLLAAHEHLGAMTFERDQALQRNDELREELADERAARRTAEEVVVELQLMIERLTTPLRTGTEG